MTRSAGHEVERLVAAERAARVAGESAARWWREINKTAAGARSDRELDALFRTALVTLRDNLDADALAVLVANQAGDELTARVAIGLSEEVTLGLGIRAGQGMSGRVIATREPLIVDDLSTIPVVSSTLRESGLRSIVAVPMLLEDRLSGVIYMGSRDLDHFTTLDAELLEIIAARLAAALERVRAFEAERDARVRAQRNADRLARLQKLTTDLMTPTTRAEIAGVLAEALALDSSGHKVASTDVWLLGGDDRLSETPPATEPGTPESLDLASELPVARAAVEKRTIYLTGSEAHPYRMDPSPGAAGSSWALLPLLVRGGCEGVVAVAYPDADSIALEEREFLGAMVEQAAQAIDRARLNEQQVALGEVASFFARAARVTAEASDFPETLGRLAELALAALGDICLIDVVGDDGRPRRMVARHRDRSHQHLVDRLMADFPPDAEGKHPAVEVIGTGRSRWSEVMSDELLRETTRNEEHLALVKALEFRSYLSVPLLSEGVTLGSLTLVSSSRPFGREDVSFAERLAEQVAAVVHNARRYDDTLRTSHVLQQSLLPQRLPQVPGVQVATQYLPATRGLDVGGDFYDLVLLPGGNAGFMVGDVAGHDRGAAALMGHLRSAARALAGQVHTPAELIAALQWSWDLLDFERIATALFGRLEPSTGDLLLASAGHYPPLLIEPGSARFLEVEPSAPLGAPRTPVYDWSGRLQPGQVLLLYTDGVIDERHQGIDESMRVLADVLTRTSTNPASVCEEVVRLLPPQRSDDVALLALRLAL